MTTYVTIDWDSHSLWLKEINGKPKPYLAITISIGQISFITKGKNCMFIIPADRQAQLSVSGVDALGNSAPLENIVYTSSNPEITNVDESGLVTPITIGSAQINVTADALIGEGETVLVGLLDIEVVAAQAVSFNINARLV